MMYIKGMHSNFVYLYWNQQILVFGLVSIQGAFLIDGLRICTAFLNQFCNQK